MIGRPFIQQEWGGTLWRAVGDTLVRRPPQETDNEFYVHVLKHTLTDNWGNAQGALHADEQHIIYRWIHAWDAFRSGDRPSVDRERHGDDLWSAAATGELRSLMALAYDVYTLRHVMALAPDDRLVRRLRDPNEFQGARYEIAVAAIVARAGYSIEWIEDAERKRPEFVARHLGNGREILAEAKSRRRAGVLDHPGEAEAAELPADVARLLRDALTKETDGLPLLVFLDLNLPYNEERTADEWIPKLHDEALAWMGDPSPERPEPYSAVFLTNFSWHWQGEEPAKGAESFVVIPVYQLHDLPPVDDVDRINEAVRQYGDIPERRKPPDAE